MHQHNMYTKSFGASLFEKTTRSNPRWVETATALPPIDVGPGPPLEHSEFPGGDQWRRTGLCV